MNPALSPADRPEALGPNGVRSVGVLRFENCVIWGSFLAVVIIAYWSARRGFDFLDTGCYFLEYKYPADVADTHTTYRLFARPFFLLAGESVAVFRYWSWGLLWVSALVFAWGWGRHINALYRQGDLRISRSVAIGMFLLASCAAYTIKPAALTYNSLNVIAVCVALGLLFDGATRLMEDEVNEGWRGVGEIAVAALVSIVDILIKPTTAAFLLAVVVGYCLVSPGISLRMKKRFLGVAAIAGAVGVLAMIVFVGGMGPFLERVKTLVSIADNRAYMGELYARTAKEFRELGAFLAHDLKFAGLALGASAVVLACLRSRENLSRAAAKTSAGIVFLLWLYSTFEGKLWRGSHQFYFDGVVARLYLDAALLASALAALVFFECLICQAIESSCSDIAFDFRVKRFRVRRVNPLLQLRELFGRQPSNCRLNFSDSAHSVVAFTLQIKRNQGGSFP